NNFQLLSDEIHDFRKFHSRSGGGGPLQPPAAFGSCTTAARRRATLRSTGRGSRVISAGIGSIASPRASQPFEERLREACHSKSPCAHQCGVRDLSNLTDLKDAAAIGFHDFRVMPTHVIFLAIIYPIVGLFLARMTFGHDVMPLLFPLAAGFALIGPFAAIGLYELSRQRGKARFYQSLFGHGSPESIGQFLSDILAPSEGGILIIADTASAFCSLSSR